MSVVLEQQQQLAAMRKRYAGRPKDELAELFLLALEREEVVAVAFRESLIARRLALLNLPAELDELIRHALVWIWKDEEMHSVYVRGAILKLGGRYLRLMAWLRQTAGAVGGWSSSVRQHLRYTDAPLSRLAADAIIFAGRLGGQIPAEVLPHLSHNTFREFCRFNGEVEKAAEVTWDEIANLAERQGATPDVVRDLRRITQDEANHAAIFTAIADALTEDDRLASGDAVARLVPAIAAAGEYFLPRRLRRDTVEGNPLGTGGVVACRQGETVGEKIPLFRRLLDQARLRDVVAARCAATGRAAGDLRVVVKTHFMMGYHRRDPSVIVDRELVVELARRLRELGCRDIVVGDTPTLYDAFFENRTVDAVAAYFGFHSPDDYRLCDLSAGTESHAYSRGYGEYEVSRAWKNADLRVTFGKLASHPVEMAALSLKTCHGVAGRTDRNLFHDRQAEYAAGIVMGCDAFPPHFALVDGYDHAPDGLLGMVGCSRPPALRRFYAGADALAVDLAVLSHLRLPLSLSPALQMAVHWFGDPTPMTRLVGEERGISGWRTPVGDDVSALLSMVSYTVFANYSGRGSLFVPEMDAEAFPPRGRVPLWTAVGRTFTQWVCGTGLRRSRRWESKS